MAALIVLVVIVPMGVIGTGIFLAASAFRAPKPARRDVGVPPAQVASRGRNPLRAHPRLHPIDGVLRVVVGTLLVTAGVSAYRALYELAQVFR